MLEFMAANHVTFVNDNVGKVPSEQMPKLEQLVRRAGYRFVLREISHPESLARGETLTVNMKWSNVGGQTVSPPSAGAVSAGSNAILITGRHGSQRASCPGCN